MLLNIKVSYFFGTSFPLSPFISLEARVIQNNDFSLLYDKYKDAVYTIAMRYLKNRDNALDISQDVFIKVHDDHKRIAEKADPGAYICRMAINRCIDFQRKNSRLFGLTALFSKPAPKPFQTPEEKDEVDYLLEPLSDDQKIAVILKEITGFTVEETARICECDTGTIKSRLSRARDKMRRQLEQRENHEKQFFG